MSKQILAGLAILGLAVVAIFYATRDIEPTPEELTDQLVALMEKGDEAGAARLIEQSAPNRRSLRSRYGQPRRSFGLREAAANRGSLGRDQAQCRCRGYESYALNSTTAQGATQFFEAVRFARRQGGVRCLCASF